jgi:hypothetical protein
MKRHLILVMIVAICALYVTACSKKAPTTGDESPPVTLPPADEASEEADTSDAAAVSETETTLAIVYCGKCGEVRDTEKCCREGADVCADCGLHKGSPMCCKELPAEVAGKDLCDKCGHVAGGPECCDDKCEICTECGRHKGSALCCKLPAA